MRFIDHQHHPPPSLVFFGCQQAVSLRDQFGSGQARMCAQRAHDGHVQAACTERRRGDVDDVVGGRIELAGRRAHRHGLADPDLAGDDAQQRLADAEADARHCLLMAGTFAQLGRRDGFREWHAAEAEVRDPWHACHGTWSSACD